ncbi:MAG: aminopeptidase P N-terminal domain-containing protein [Bacteroidales bacterium]|nr:aminopeptidase P N-terminal domain-containing protein [Bacteroidales bacterium]
MFSRNIYVSRRQKLIKSVKEGLLLFLGNGEAPLNYSDNQYTFRQDSTWLYYFGIDKPDMAAIIDVESGEEKIFGDDVDIDDIIWMGPQPSVASQAEDVGVSRTAPLADLDRVVKAALARGRKVHFLPPYRFRNMIWLNSLLGVGFDRMKEEASVEFIKAVVEMRLVKEPCEIQQIDLACNLGYAMHMAATKLMKPGMLEQDLVGVMEGVVISGGYIPSFPTILSQNGETLHNHSHHQVLTEGRLTVIDAGAEIASHYCSDFTRTLPCSGRFTEQQKDIYTIVSEGNNLALGLARPDISYREVHLSVCRLMLQGLKNLGLVKGDVDEALAAGAAGLFMPHGLGHNMGLDVHDMENLGENYVGYDETVTRSTQLGLGSLRMARVLKPGNVVTDEPGIYFIPALIDKWKAEGTCRDFIAFDKLDAYRSFGGIRIEDDLLITESGARLLGSKRLPRTVEEVENAMAQE